MRNIFMLGLLTLAFCISTISRQQGPAKRDWDTDVLPKLRELLKVPPSAQFRPVKSNSLPAADPLKLCVEAIEDPDVRSALVEWVRKWNKENGHNYGSIEVVPDPALADLSVFRVTGPSRISSPKLTGKDQIVEADGAVLVRKPPDVEVWGSWKETITVGEYKLAARLIGEQIEQRMKQRAKEKRK
jgi:hypothetical protein